MPKEERPRGAAGMLPEEAEQAGEAKMEVRDLHEPFKQWLDLHGIYYIYARPDKKSGIREGAPDFHIIHGGKACCIEFKRPGGHLSEKQHECRKEIEASGTPYRLAYSFAAAVEFVKFTFEIQC